MNRHLLPILAGALLALPALATPPAPAHEIIGTVRGQTGRPLDPEEGVVILYGASSNEVIRANSDPLVGVGLNYRLSVPMDAGLIAGLYQPNALIQGNGFTIRVVVAGVTYVPIQMASTVNLIGRPGDKTRLDLFLGVDSDGDGLPDQWEQNLVDSDNTGNLLDITDINPGDDLDGDGMTNLQEFMLGTYALGSGDALTVTLMSIDNGRARLKFRGIRGRRYGIESSTDLVHWTPAQLSVSATGSLGSAYNADITGTHYVHSPAASTGGKVYYRLHAQ